VIHEIKVSPEHSLLDVLRQEVKLTGTKYGCGEGNCGACTVLIDGEPMRSCITSVGSVTGREVTTVEGLAVNGHLNLVQKAFVENSAFQCGYCTPGFVISATALLSKNSAPDISEIKSALSGHICRCGAYVRILKAVQQASDIEGLA
jgi:aerobic-type carbon monoxide dehydrogenase small subunit (CoxS/CutS family)